jgi:hypothetical protein
MIKAPSRSRGLRKLVVLAVSGTAYRVLAAGAGQILIQRRYTVYGIKQL